MDEEIYRGCKIEILPDEDPLSPRDDDNVGTMVCWHSRYKLGDEQPKIESSQFLESLALKKVDRSELLGDDVISPEHIQKILDKHFVVLPLYLYDHSGICMQTSPYSCQWDSGQVGWIYCDKVKAKEWYGGEPDQAQIEKNLTQEVASYSAYISGGYVGYRISRKSKELESCWGFDDDKYCLSEAKSVVDYLIKQQKELKKQKALNGEHVVI